MNAGLSVAAYSVDVAQAMAPGATLRIRFDGALVHILAMGLGKLDIRIAGDPQLYAALVTSGSDWNFVPLVPMLPAGPHVVEVTVLQLPVVFGDVFVSGGPGRGA